MERKVIKPARSKGERLGWTPIEKVKSVSLSAIIIKGCRVTPLRYRNTNTVQQQPTITFLIP